ncbi:universal stress protein [Alteromonas sp. A081]|uniref:universal stress protein n=1 Tax=Alteromonas sp. A081 TaxID=3410269 RepID=UPI003B98576F
MTNSAEPCVLCVFDEVNDATALLIQKSQLLSQAENLQLKFLCVLPDRWFHYSSESAQHIQDRAKSRVLEQLSHLATVHNINDNIACEVRFGKPFVEIIQYQQRVNAQLVVKRAEQKSWIQHAVTMTSNDMHLLRKCPVPVFLVRSQEATLPQNIFVAVDFDIDDPTSHADELNKKMLGTVVRFFDNDETQCTLFNAYNAPHAGFVSLFADDPDTMTKDMAAHEKGFKSGELNLLLHFMRESLAPKYLHKHIKQVLIQGHAEQLIPQQLKQHQSDLLVIGSVARTGIPGLLIGNTAEEILLSVDCDVLTLKPDGFVSPVLEH